MNWKGALLAATGVVTAVLIGLTIAWYRNDWDLEAAAWTGDSVSPIAGALSLLAVAAALWSVHLQERDLREQQKALQKQQDALDQQNRYQRQTALREAYAPLLAAVDTYLDTVERYREQIKRAPGTDAEARREWANPCRLAHLEVLRSSHSAQLVDAADPTRGALRRDATQAIELEPPWDVSKAQLAYSKVIEYQTLVRRQEIARLVANLVKALGGEPRAPDASAAEAVSMAAIAAEQALMFIREEQQRARVSERTGKRH